LANVSIAAVMVLLSAAYFGSTLSKLAAFTMYDRCSRHDSTVML
jgi:hypothetical protein